MIKGYNEERDRDTPIIYISATSIMSDQEMRKRESRKIAQGSPVYKINSVDNSSIVLYLRIYDGIAQYREKRREEFRKNVY